MESTNINNNDNSISSNEVLSKESVNIIIPNSINKSPSSSLPIIINDPKNWPKKKKLHVLLIIAFASILIGMGGSILYPALISIQNDLETTEFLTNFLIAIYLMFFGIGQLGWASYSDIFKTRRKMFLGSFLVYLIASIISAVSNSIWLLCLMRVFQALGTSADQCVGAGIISDIFIPTGYIVGQITGPVVGGFVTEYLGWHWIFWFTSIFILYLVTLTAVSYVQDIMLSRNFVEKYDHINSFDIGLIYLSPTIGYLLGSLFSGRYSDFILRAFIIPIAYISYGWLLNYNAHISLPIISLFIGGFTTLMAQNPTSTYLVDVNPKYSSSAIATCSCLRYVYAGIMVALSVKIDETIGVGWTYTLVSSMNAFSIIFIIVVYFKGKKWRNEMKVGEKDVNYS
ncbi:16019_t:CDS:2 [Entrophospora sp. SA101]|nr:16019_t:CDS:2 [Entrophospora sp. SA101]